MLDIIMYTRYYCCAHLQMCSLTVEMMKEKGLTEGAAKKLHKKLEELKYVCYLSLQLHLHMRVHTRGHLQLHNTCFVLSITSRICTNKAG